MNAILRFGTLLSLLIVGSIAFAQQQQSPSYQQQATFSENMALELPDADVLPYSYEVDIANIAFKDDAAAERFFNSITDNLVTYELKENNKVIVLLRYEHLGEQKWGREEWSAYLNKVSARYKDYYDRINAQ